VRLWDPASLREPIDLTPAPLSGIEVIEDPKGIRERVEQLSGLARHSICALQPCTGVHRDRSASRAQPRATPTRLVVESGSAGEYGSVTVRCSPNPLPCRMVIIDEEIAVTVGQSPASRGVAMVVEEPVLVQGLLCLFEATWTACTRAMRDSPTLDERNLLERMATGSTDEAIARLLGISDRQVRRRTARLLQRLGVSSRFAAGAEAVRRGWL
jgi:DNA-binding CsgD family transcriptional regulator